MRTKASSCVMLSLLLAGACNIRNPGVDPPGGTLSYPIGLAFGKPEAAGPGVLYVANSNFRLQYNAGSVQAYDLRALEKKVKGCRLKPTQGAEADGGLLDGGFADMDASAGDDADGGVGLPLEPTTLSPTPSFDTEAAAVCDDRAVDDSCCFDDNEELLLSNGGEILIDSYASGIAVAPDGKRLYVPIRSRDRLLYLDVDSSGRLSCGGGSRVCTRGIDDTDKTAGIDDTFAPQPTDLAAGRLSDLLPGPDGAKAKGTFIATAHEFGDVSFFVDFGKGPVLQSTLAPTSGITRLTAIKADPANDTLYVTNSTTDRVPRYAVIERSGGRYELLPAASLGLGQVAASVDTRDIEIDRVDPKRIYVLMRGFAHALLFYRLDPAANNGARLEGEVRVGFGASKITQTTLGGRRLLLVSCYDERAIYVVEESTRDLVSVIRGVSGPFEMLVDEARNMLYVADFRANVLRVIDVKGLADTTYPPPRIIATLGTVTAVGGLK